MLRYFLWANCFSCAVFGVLFLVSSAQAAQFIGSPPVVFLRAAGLLLTLNAVLLAYTAVRLCHIPKVILFFVAGDAGWVALTAICLIFGAWIEGTAATLASVVVAMFVGGLGIGQYVYGIAGMTRESHTA